VANRASQPGLDRMWELVRLLGDPQDAYPVVHLTGTNGKGSTARMLTCLLSARGLRVGTYTSPDLERVNERLALAGRPIDDESLSEVLASVADAASVMEDPPSRFEILSAAAFSWFADEAVDAAVVEVGLGGRRDATNVVHGRVAAVTNVALDHAEVIGPTLADIAREKAGIVEPGSTLVLGETEPELASIFRAAGASQVWERGQEFGCEANRVAHGGRLLDLRTPGARYPGVYLPLHGAHQGDNAACALAAAEAFFGGPLHPDVVSEAMAEVTCPGRMEVVGRRPLLMLDGAHNPAGARAAGATLEEEFGAVRRRVLVMGLLQGRDPAEMFEALGLGRLGAVVACRPPSPRALPPVQVAAAARHLGVAAEVVEDPAAALARARALAGPEDLVLVTGSLYVVGAARASLLGHPPHP
jgi:dihydrofolate synthase/folylpolyglutamate synthase